MAEPRALDGMPWDDRQLLKEAVCDAVLERTRRVVSGEGVYGAAVLGEKPSRILSSAFILPRLNEDGDDESSDIKIPAHGMDLRVRPSGGALQVLGGRLRIPDRLSRRYDIPQKWIRLGVDPPALTLPLPCDPEQWQRLAAEHKAQLLASIRTAYMDWIASPDGQAEAWRKRHPP